MRQSFLSYLQPSFPTGRAPHQLRIAFEYAHEVCSKPSIGGSGYNVCLAGQRRSQPPWERGIRLFVDACQLCSNLGIGLLDHTDRIRIERRLSILPGVE